MKAGHYCLLACTYQVSQSNSGMYSRIFDNRVVLSNNISTYMYLERSLTSAVGFMNVYEWKVKYWSFKHQPSQENFAENVSARKLEIVHINFIGTDITIANVKFSFEDHSEKFEEDMLGGHSTSTFNDPSTFFSACISKTYGCSNDTFGDKFRTLLAETLVTWTIQRCPDFDEK